MSEYNNPIPTVDIVIEYPTKDEIVLIKRKNPPHGFAIPGGFAEVGLTLEQNAKKEAKEETNLEIEIRNPGHPYVYSDPNRDPRGHMISNVFYATGSGDLQAGDDAKEAHPFKKNQVIDLIKRDEVAFDHALILQDYYRSKEYENE